MDFSRGTPDVMRTMGISPSDVIMFERIYSVLGDSTVLVASS